MTELLAKDDILNQLEQSKSNQGIQFYDHFTKFLQNLVKQNNQEMLSLQNIEKVSNYIKQSHLVYHQAKTDNFINNLNTQPPIQWVDDCLQLLEQSKQKNKQIKIGFVQNFQKDSSLLEWAGISFGEKETFWIQKSLNVLASTNKTISIRFWGKILTSGKDYYVIESKAQFNQKVETLNNYEPEGVGINSLQFWVTHNIFGDWIKLPQISPEHIKISKHLNIILTGNLEHKIVSYPVFNGNEKHYLKALLVRITFGTTIVPKDYFKFNEENPTEIEFNEEFKIPELPELINGENWCFQYPCILNSGRATYPTDIPQEQIDEMKEKDPQPERLASISTSKPPNDGTETSWLNRFAGDSQQYNQIGADEGVVQSYGYQITKSYQWQGALTIANTKKFIGIYVGYGHKLGIEPIFPTQPNLIQNDPEEGKEEYEPNPKNQPKKAEVAEGEEGTGEGGQKLEQEEELEEE